MRDPQPWHRATLRAYRDLTPTVREFELSPDAGSLRPWAPGSHLNVQLPLDGGAETRSYSLVGLHRDGDTAYRIAVKRVAASRGGSRRLWSLPVGAELRIGEPANHFELPLAAPQYLLIAGGIGVTPLVAMAQQLAARAADVRMLYAARHAGEFALRDVLHAALGERLELRASEAGRRIAFDAEIAALHPQAVLLVCGPLTMLDAARAAWARSGRPATNLRFETFGSGGAAPNEAFWVRLPRHGAELQVPPERTLLDVLNEHGIDTLFDCRRGECGLCAVDIVEVHGRVDHRDVFLSASEKAANRRLCACVSRVSGGGLVLDSAYRPD